MTIVQNQPEADMENYKLVRETTKRVVGIYGQVKNYSPMLKTGLEAVESQIPGDWIERVNAASEPVIDRLDCRIDEFNKKVISPVSKSVSERVITPVQELQKVSFTDVKDAVTAKTTAVTAAAGEKVGQWKSMRGDLSKKAVERLERGLTQVREFSATRGKEIIHFDLIEYAEEVIDNASAAAKPVYEKLEQNLALAIVKVNSAKVALQEAIAQKSAQTVEQMESLRAELKVKLHNAMQAARELSSSSVTYVHAKYKYLESQVPEKYQPQQLIESLPQPAIDSIKFILNSPQLFIEVKNKADIQTSNKAIENVNNLLTAIKEVVLAQVPGSTPPEPEPEPEAEGAEAAAEEE